MTTGPIDDDEGGDPACWAHLFPDLFGDGPDDGGPAPDEVVTGEPRHRGRSGAAPAD